VLGGVGDVGVSATGIDGGAADGVEAAGGAAGRRGALGFGAAFLTATLALGLPFWAQLSPPFSQP